MRREASVLALTFLLAGLGAGPARADGVTPPGPPGISVPTPTSTPTGPTYVVTPGVGGSELPHTTDPSKAAEQAKQAVPKKHRAKKDDSGSIVIPDPVAAAPTTAAGPKDSTREDLVWEIGAGVLLVVVLSEVFRLGFRRRSRVTAD